MPNWKKIITSGSDATLNSLSVINGITGSLLGTASYASNLGGFDSTHFVDITSSQTIDGQKTFWQSVLLGEYNYTNGKIFFRGVDTGNKLSIEATGYGDLIFVDQTGSVLATLYQDGLGFELSSGKFIGTASFADTASVALSASYAPDTTFPYTGSAIISGSLVVTGSINSTTGFTGSLLGTASYALSASNADTLDGLNSTDFVTVSGDQNINSNKSISSLYKLSFVGPLDGVVSIKGGSIDDLSITDDLLLLDNSGNTLAGLYQDGTGFKLLSGSFIGNLIGTASLALTASFVRNAISASYVLNAISASYAATASFAPLYVLTSATSSMLAPYVLNSQTSSFVLNSQTSSFVLNSQTSSFVLNSQTSSFVLNSQTSSFVLNSQTSSFVTNSQTSSFVTNSQTSSFVLNSQTSSFVTNSQTSSFVTNSQTSSMSVATASYVLNAVSASFATTASYILNAVSASNANLLDGLDSNDFVQTSTNQTITGNKSFRDTTFFGTNSSDGKITFVDATNDLSMSISIDTESNLIIQNAEDLTLITIAQNGDGITLASGNFIGNLTGTADTASFYSGSVVSSSYASSSTSASYALNSTSASYALNATSASYVLNAVSSSFASTASFVNRLNQSVNINGNSTVTGSLTVTNDLIVLGSASFQFLSQSTLNIGTNLITVNTFSPSARFGGLAIIDSGSSPLTSASFLYDSTHDEFVFVHRGDGTNVTSSHFLVGPQTYNDLGNEIYIPNNTILKSQGNEHVTSSNITDTGTLVGINSNTTITGSFTVITGSNIELQVLNTGVRLGNVITDAHTVTGSLGVSGSLNINGNTNITGSAGISSNFSTTGFPLQVKNSGYFNAHFQGTTANNQASFYLENDRGGFASYGGFLYGGSTSNLGNFFGVSRADRLMMLADGASNLGFYVGTLTSQPFVIGTNNIERLKVNGAGGVGIIGDLTITGSGTNATTIRGAGATSATYALRTENSAGTNIARFRNDGYVEFGTSGFSSLQGASYGFLFDGGGTRQITFTLNSANGARIGAGSIGLNAAAGSSHQVIQISGNANLGGTANTQVVDLGGTYSTFNSNTTMDMMALSPAFILTSSISAPAANILRMGFSINHTSGSQIIHGINHSPTLTAAANFRAFSFTSANAYRPSSSVADYMWSLITPNISASVNNQLITGLDITLSGSNGAFTGVRRSALRLSTQNTNDNALTAIGNVTVTGSISASGSLAVNAITSSGIISIGRSTTSQAVIQRAQAPAGAYSTILAAGTGIVDTFPYTMTDSHGATIDMRGGDPTSDQYVGGIIFSANGNTSPLGEGNAIVFKNRTGVSTYTERMRITHDGNVGIGVSSPTTKLHVDGTVRIDNQGGSSINTLGSATPSNYYGGGSSGGVDYLSDPAIWLKINLDGTEYFFPGYQ